MDAFLEVANYVNGSWVKSEETVNRYNPGDLDDIVYSYYNADSYIINKCMVEAKRAFNVWKIIKPNNRADILRKWLNLIELKADNLAEIITRETGKILKESQAEIRSALSDANFVINHFQKESNNDQFINGSEEIKTTLYYEPIGVFILITPWNFPLATLIRKIIPALLYGNSIVVKPSEFASATACFAFQLFDEISEMPDGAVNLILGEGSVIGPELIKNKQLHGISFTGSFKTGKQIQKQAAGRNVRLQMEMGGNNGMVVLSDADLDKAAKATVTGAFSCAGQWCTGTSRVFVESKVYENFTDNLINLVKQIAIGPGHKNGVDMGPVAHEENFRNVLKEIKRAQYQGGKIMAGGNAIQQISESRGWFIEPTVISEVASNVDVDKREIFGPVLFLTRFKNKKEVLDKVNNSKYGLSFSIYTSNRQEGLSFLKQVEVGICHLNLNTAYREPHLPIHGWKKSGYGVPEGGLYGKEFYAQPKAVYLN